MAGTITLSSKLTPFPFAAIAIATYTQKASLVFDETATAITLDLNGSKLTAEDEIVRALAKAGELPGDSSEVTKMVHVEILPLLTTLGIYFLRLTHSLPLQRPYLLSTRFLRL
jgi:hypothetical protein